MASIGAVGGTTQNLKLYFAMDRGMAQGRVAELISLVLVGSIAGRLLMGWLADRWPRKRVMLLIYLIVAGTIPLLWAAPSPIALRAAAVAFGVGLGGDYMIIPLMAADLFGLKRMGRVMGIVLTADGVAEAVVPMAVATLRDRSGSYGPGFALLVALAVLGAVAVSFLPRPRPAGPARRPGGPREASPDGRGLQTARNGQNEAVAGHTRPSVNKRLREARRRKSRWPRRSAAPSARKAESRRARRRRGRIPTSPASSRARSPFPGATTSRPASAGSAPRARLALPSA